MATELGDDFDFTARATAKTKYPWREWCNGKVWEVTEITDFAMSAKSFRNYLHNVARQWSNAGYGVGSEVLPEGQELRVQATIRDTDVLRENRQPKETEYIRKVIFRFYNADMDYDDEEYDGDEELVLDDETGVDVP